MKKIFFTVLILFFMPTFSLAVEELPEIELENTEEETLDFEGKVEKNNIYLDEEDKLKLHLDGHLIKELKVGAVYNGGFSQHFQDNPSDYYFGYDINFLDTWVEGKFKDDKTSFKINVNPIRHVPKRNYMATLWQDVWIRHDFNEHQSITAGYFRTPNGKEGSMSSYVQDLAYRSQIARTFANARATGVRNSGRYKYFDYDIGVFDSARYFDKCMQGFEVVAKGTFKPLEFADGKYGHLNIMASINSGKRKESYTVVNAAVSYNYKKFTIDGEYAHANGYNGAVNMSTNKAQGFYTSIKYELTKKVHLVARYDLFDPNTSISGNNIEEYSVGINYYPFKHVKLMLDYVFRNNHATTTSNQIIFITQFQL